MRVSDSIVNIRAGEEGKLWFRSDRFFKIADKWFFSTRDNQDVGPFNSRIEAVNALAVLFYSIFRQNKDSKFDIRLKLMGERGTPVVH